MFNRTLSRVNRKERYLKRESMESFFMYFIYIATMCLLCFANSKQRASLDAIFPYANNIYLLLYINIFLQSLFSKRLYRYNLFSFLFIFFSCFSFWIPIYYSIKRVYLKSYTFLFFELGSSTSSAKYSSSDTYTSSSSLS